MSQTTRSTRTAHDPSGSTLPEEAASETGHEGKRSRARALPPLGFFASAVLALVIMALGAGSAYLIGSRGEPIYGSQVEILYQAGPTAFDTETQRLLETQEVILHSNSVLQSVAASSGLSTEELDENLSTEVVGQTSILRFTVENPDPVRANQLAEAITESFLQTVSVRLSEKEAEELRTDTGSEIYGLLMNDGSLRVLTPARILPEPLAPKPEQSAIAGLLAGAAIAAGLLLALAQPGFRPQS